MIRNVVRTALIAALVVAFAAAAADAQTTVKTNKATVTFSGKLSLASVYRSSEYFTATTGDGTDTNPGGIPFVDRTNGEIVSGSDPNIRDGGNASEWYIDPILSLNFAIDVGEKARGVIEIRTPFVNPDAGGKNSSPSTGFFAGFQGRTLEVKQLYAELNELFQPGDKEKDSGLMLRAGIMDFRKDLRGDGNAFLIDVSGSESPFDSLNGTGSPMRYSAGMADSQEAAGGYARYRVSVVDVDAWFFNLDEGYNAQTNNTTGNNARRDLLFWGASTDIYFDTERRLGKLTLSLFDLMNSSSTNVVTEGIGVVVNPFWTTEVNFLKVWGEVYAQQGTYARNVGTFSKIKQQDAYAFELGAQGKLQPIAIAENKKFTPYAEVSYVQVSGDKDAENGTNQNFISLENNNRTVVVENGYYGFDFDTNYRGPRLALGFHLDKFQFEILYAYFELMRNSSNRYSGNGTGGNNTNKIGDELDFTFAYEYSEALKFAYQSGFLFDSHAMGQLAATHISLFTIAMEF